MSAVRMALNLVDGRLDRSWSLAEVLELRLVHVAHADALAEAQRSNQLLHRQPRF